MLTIRPQQMRVFANAKLESWIVEHLAEFFPDEIAGLDSAEILSRVRAAIEQADRHGLVTDSQMCRYVDLTFILGPAFVQDPNLRWAAEILADERLTDPEMRMELLFGAARDHVTRIESIDASQEVAG
jgi:hypothetical protein